MYRFQFFYKVINKSLYIQFASVYQTFANHPNLTFKKTKRNNIIS